MKVVLLIEARLPTLTTLVVEDVEENQRQLTRNLNFLEEVRECAQIRKTTYHHKARAFMTKRRISKVCKRRMATPKDPRGGAKWKIWGIVGRLV